MSVCHLRSTGSSSESRRRPPHSNASRNSLSDATPFGDASYAKAAMDFFKAYPDTGALPIANSGEYRPLLTDEGVRVLRKFEEALSAVARSRMPEVGKERILLKIEGGYGGPNLGNGTGSGVQTTRGRGGDSARDDDLGREVSRRHGDVPGGRPSANADIQNPDYEAKTVLEAEEPRLLFALLPVLDRPEPRYPRPPPRDLGERPGRESRPASDFTRTT